MESVGSPLPGELACLRKVDATTGFSVSSHRSRLLLLLALVLLTSWTALAAESTLSLVPPAWPAAGLAVGILLNSSQQSRRPLLAAIFALVLIAHLANDFAPGAALVYSALSVGEALLVRRHLCHGLVDGHPPALLDTGDVSRMIRATSIGAAASAIGYGLVAMVLQHGEPLLAALAVFGTHAAAVMVLLPWFLETPHFPPLADMRERVTQSVIVVVTTVAVFASTDVPPAVFVVMPMFAWLGFRGTLREATALLTVVALISTVMTSMEIGPVAGLSARYGLADEVVIGYLQLFLLDCGLILLPLSVLVAQQRSSEALAAAGREHLDRLVASATGTAIITTDRLGRIALFNPGAEAMLGHRAEEILGEVPDVFLSVQEQARQVGALPPDHTFVDVCGVVAASADPRRLWQFVRKDGQMRTGLMTVAPIPDEKGALTGYLFTVEDVTEREQAQAALALALAQQDAAITRLRELDQIKTDFISTASHELRTPVTSIIGYTELLAEGDVGELSAPQRNLLDRVDRNGQRLLTLIEDLLTLSRVESAELGIDRVPCDLRTAVSGAFDAMAPILSTRQLEVNLTVPPTPVTCHGDLAQLERMTLNLLTNAVKFTPDDGTVDIILTADGSTSRLSIQDTGCGIPEAEQDQLFTRFFRSSTANDLAIQGTGLGLAIVHLIATAHDGTADLYSAAGEGTTAVVTLPLGLPARPVAA